MNEPRFGISTHLFHEQVLSREHLVHIAAHHFETVELFGTRAHFDYRSPEAVTQLAEWLSDTRLELHSMHAPIVDAMRGGAWVGAYSNAAGDETRRRAAVAETVALLDVARQLPYRFLVLHLGVPNDKVTEARENQPAAARRSVEEIAEAAERAGVKVALELMPNALSSAEALVRLIEEDLDGLDVGVCFDFGHAHLLGDVGEAMETLSGHVWTTHVHDNAGRRDDHLMPFQGTIDWNAALMETQKVGYDGVLMFEVGDAGAPLDVLARTVRARERLEQAFVTF